MPSLRALLWTSVGKKMITGLTGILLVLFITAHLVGNMTIFIGPDAFNRYAHFLETLIHGWALVAFEIGLAAIIIFHVLAAVTVSIFDKEAARPVKYRKIKDAGGPSRKTLSSRSMIVTGSVIFVFIILHVRMFKFGHAAMVPLDHGEEMRDLFSLVVWSFKNVWIMLAYVAVMILLGSHLWHGFWSAFQSLGWTNERLLPFWRGLGIIAALLLAAGFIVVPIYAYLGIDPHSLNIPQAGGF